MPFEHTATPRAAWRPALLAWACCWALGAAQAQSSPSAVLSPANQASVRAQDKPEGLSDGAVRHAPKPPRAAGEGPRQRVPVALHILRLHQRLNITPAQESAWNDVAQALRDGALELDIALARRGALQQAGPVSAPTALAGDARLAQVQADAARHLASRFDPLYAQMSPEQQQRADRVFAHPMAGARR